MIDFPSFSARMAALLIICLLAFRLNAVQYAFDFHSFDVYFFLYSSVTISLLHWTKITAYNGTVFDTFHSLLFSASRIFLSNSVAADANFVGLSTKTVLVQRIQSAQSQPLHCSSFSCFSRSLPKDLKLFDFMLSAALYCSCTTS